MQPLSKRRRNNAQALPTLFDELIFEILSWVPVKSLLVLRSVCKSWKAIISDQSFIKFHLQRSPKDAYVITASKHGEYVAAQSCKMRSLFENPTSTDITDSNSCYLFKTDEYCFNFVGSCNGLVCSLGSAITDSGKKVWVRFWNPATRLLSKNSANLLVDVTSDPFTYSMFGFGYDHLTNTYKVIVICYDEEGKITWMKVHNMGDNSWRDIQNFPDFLTTRTSGQVRRDGIYISNNLNWIAVSNSNPFRKFVIVSLDLGDETFTLMSMPCAFDEVYLEVPFEELYIFLGVLMDCLCVSYDDFYKGTNFVVWQMKEFGVEKSWTKLLNVSYYDLKVDCELEKRHLLSLYPLRMYKNGDFLITLLYYDDLQAVMYNQRDKRVELVKFYNSIEWIFETDYIQSLVSPL
ncbi:unnamed protein product [Lupinus luteus]|uniref:F-box domain-containing protein n=1 Tax=Lupinus luteus TaxID=3873 RepID=A0AAV1WC22_LUPLU